MVGGASWASWKQSDEQQEQEVGFPYKRSPQVTSLYLATDRIPYNESSGKECEYEFFRNQTRLYLAPQWKTAQMVAMTCLPPFSIELGRAQTTMKRVRSSPMCF